MNKNPQLRNSRENRTSARSRIFQVLALVAATCLSAQELACDDNRIPEIPAQSTSKPPLPMKPVEVEIRHKPVPGVLKTLTPTRTCDLDIEALKQMEPLERFMTVGDKCKGKGQAKGPIMLQTTIPGYHADSVLFQGLERIFDSTGYSSKLPQVAARVFLFHRMDGKDGLPGGNLISFAPHAMTSAQPGVSMSFSSIPMRGDKSQDISALATEICQSKMLAEKDQGRAESVCNSYGRAVNSIYDGHSYEQYRQLMLAAKGVMPDGTRIPFTPYPKEIYELLKVLLKDLPDILVPNQ